MTDLAALKREARAALAFARHPNPNLRQALLQNANKIDASVRPQILAQLSTEGETS
ncbi:hypothetical protein GCM10017783_12380 [Deinococcus piscis]|uniref:Uncharacterized protein n=1 Tax=Deinococcus piscis TaxID=394230 RepID=A0ABQ3K4C5_9DEIO|nr:hypothetical protein [Deinococcus piscis]GHG01658.1 hypothetical protein GCM10017783_12380 [Deinococcus piscis]